MALNNSQYDEIFRSYDAKQLKAQHQLEERTKAAYERTPELKALDASIAAVSYTHLDCTMFRMHSLPLRLPLT